MLVLQRGIGESLIIDNHIEVQVVSVRGDNVKLGIVAPKEISVHRKEIQDKINKELLEV